MKSCRLMALRPRPHLRLALAIALLAAIAASVTLPSALAHGGSSDDEDADATPSPGAGAGTDHHHTNLRSKPLLLTKIWCLIIVFFATFLAGVSPYFCRWNRSFLVLGTRFAGGVFLGTALMHFLSDADSTFKDRSSKDYPFAFMLASAGYLLTMCGDCVIQWVLLREKPSPKGDVETGHNYTGAGAQGLPVEDASACKSEATTDVNLEAKNFVAALLVKTTSFGDTLLLTFALCFHSVFEGIAIGVAETEANAWRALWTISLHKIFAAIAMGIALLRLLPERPLLSTSLYSFAFGISSPVGVAIGIIIDATTEGAVADWMYAIAMGLACGVFIYVAINHLLAKGYVPDCKVAVDTPFWRFLAATLGVGVIAVVMIWD